MKQMTWAEMRVVADRELRAYRKNAMLLRCLEWNADAPSSAPAGIGREEREEIARAALWHRTIESVRSALRAEDPVRERFFVRYYALRVPPNRRQTQRARHLQLAHELNVSDSTLYKWKEAVLQRVVAAALQLGAPFSGDPG